MVWMDLRMPRLDGRETLSSLRERWPALPVILSSGYYGDDFVAGGEQRPRNLRLLPKPYSLAQLQQVLAQSIQGA